MLNKLDTVSVIIFNFTIFKSSLYLNSHILIVDNHSTTVTINLFSFEMHLYLNLVNYNCC